MTLFASFLAGCSAGDSNTNTQGFTLAVVANRADDSLTVVNAATLSVDYASIPLSGTEPTEIIAGEDGLVFVLNAQSNNVSVVDPVSGSEVDVIALSGIRPIAAVLAPNGFLYVAFDGSSIVSKVDVTSAPRSEIATIATSLAGANAIGVTNDGASLYVAGAGVTSLSKIDLTTELETGLVALGM